MLSKPRRSAAFGISLAVTCLQAKRQPLLRGHDFYSGLFVEHRKPCGNAKGKHQVGETRRLPMCLKVADEPVVVKKYL